MESRVIVASFKLLSTVIRFFRVNNGSGKLVVPWKEVLIFVGESPVHVVLEKELHEERRNCSKKLQGSELDL